MISLVICDCLALLYVVVKAEIVFHDFCIYTECDIRVLEFLCGKCLFTHIAHGGEGELITFAIERTDN